MGQMALGILYGCEAPLVETDEDGEFWHTFADGFNGPYDWRKPTPQIRLEREGGKDLLGVWVAVGGSGEDGAPYFTEEAMALDQIATVYAKSIKRAERFWTRFAVHCQKKHHILLPSPILWLTPCEVA